MSASELTKRQVWIRSGGRCVICHDYLLDDHLEDSSAIRQIGEVAHIAGEAEGGPRSESEVPMPDRNEAANLILLCPNHHRSADKRRLKDAIYTEEFLLARKQTWEAFVKNATGLSPDLNTTVLRLVGTVKGAPGSASVADAATAVMAHSRRMPKHLLDLPGSRPDIDLGQLAEATDGTDWGAAVAVIDAGIARFHLAATNEQVSHISVFAIAYVPLLVALGSRLDDTVDVDIYERHRSTESWVWNEAATAVPFAFSMADEVTGDEGVLIVNASGTVAALELPANLRDLPRFVIEPASGATPSTSTFESAETLAMFDATVLAFFAEMEVHHRHIRRLHVMAAVPVSAAVTLGRRLAADTAAPAFALYHRRNSRYLRVLDIPTITPTDDTQEAQL